MGYLGASRYGTYQDFVGKWKTCRQVYSHRTYSGLHWALLSYQSCEMYKLNTMFYAMASEQTISSHAVQGQLCTTNRYYTCDTFTENTSCTIKCTVHQARSDTDGTMPKLALSANSAVLHNYFYFICRSVLLWDCYIKLLHCVSVQIWTKPHMS